MCIGGTCINKYNIKYIKGKVPFSINTFTDLIPFQGYSSPGYSGWKTMIGTQPQNNISINGNPLKAIQITSDLYKVTAYSEPNFQGVSHDITENTSDLTKLFPNGVKSIIPKSKKGNLLNNTCLGKDSLEKQGGTATGYFPKPCDLISKEDKLFYFHRNELIEHAHDNEAIHFLVIKEVKNYMAIIVYYEFILIINRLFFKIVYYGD